jgi:hypothetical protein
MKPEDKKANLGKVMGAFGPPPGGEEQQKKTPINSNAFMAAY